MRVSGPFIEGHGREDEGGVAGVHARVLDVLRHSVHKNLCVCASMFSVYVEGKISIAWALFAGTSGDIQVSSWAGG